MSSECTLKQSIILYYKRHLRYFEQHQILNHGSNHSKYGQQSQTRFIADTHLHFPINQIILNNT